MITKELVKDVFEPVPVSFSSGGDNPKYNIPIPAPDIYQAVVRGVFSTGKTEYLGKWREQLTIVFEIDGTIETEGDYYGKRYNIKARWVTNSITKADYPNQSVLSKIIRACTGLQEIPRSFDATLLIGENCQLEVVHRANKNDPSKVYANIANYMRLPKSAVKMAIEVPYEAIPEYILQEREENNRKYNEFMASIQPKTDAESLANSQPPADDNDDFQSSSKAMADAKGSSTEEAMTSFYERVDAESPF